MGAKKLSFEESVARLDDIVKHLENGDMPLSESLSMFEEGTKLTAYCSRLLKEAEQKIVKLTDVENGDGAPALSDRQGEDMGAELSDRPNG